MAGCEEESRGRGTGRLRGTADSSSPRPAHLSFGGTRRRVVSSISAQQRKIYISRIRMLWAYCHFLGPLALLDLDVVRSISSPRWRQASFAFRPRDFVASLLRLWLWQVVVVRDHGRGASSLALILLPLSVLYSMGLLSFLVCNVFTECIYSFIYRKMPCGPEHVFSVGYT